MRKIHKQFILIGLLWLSAYPAFSQLGEFQYFVLRMGLNHSGFTPQPLLSENKFLVTSNGEMPLTPSHVLKDRYIDYGLSYTMDLHFHYDFQTDKQGIIIGVQFFNNIISSKYVTEQSKNPYWLIEKHRVFSVGIPLMLKLSNEIYDRQKYAFIGAQYNWNLAVAQIQTSNLDEGTGTGTAISRLSKNQFKPNNYVFFAGFNYLIMNVELDFMPDGFLNKDYTIADKFRPYENHANNLFFLKTSVNIPLSKWTTRHNYFLHRLFRRMR